MLRAFPSAFIENLRPLLDGGRYPVKRVVGEDLAVEADVFKDGHDVVAAALKWRTLGETHWQETPMHHLDNDRWRGVCPLYENAISEYTVEAWTDTFLGWREEFAKKFEAGVPTLTTERLEGALLLEAAAERAYDYNDANRLHELSKKIQISDAAEVNAIAHSGELEGLMATYPDRAGATQYSPAPRVIVDRTIARTAAWYEFFPRSAEGRSDRGSTLRASLPRIDDAKAMGFDVLYFPPIHPIGRTNRKGRNNTMTPSAEDPGSPYAIGAAEGGHDAIHPELGTIEDFRALRDAAAEHGLELALD